MDGVRQERRRKSARPVKTGSLHQERSRSSLESRTEASGPGSISSLPSPREGPRKAHRSKLNKRSNDLVSQQENLLPALAAESSRSPHRTALSPQDEQMLVDSSQPQALQRRSRKRKAVAALPDAASFQEESTHTEANVSLQSKDVSQRISPQTESMSMELERLKADKARLEDELARKTVALDEQKETISFIYSQCTCTVCLELVWRPHVLSPCGHVFCARCLIAWFTKPNADEVMPRTESEEERRAAERRRTLRRAKVCPHCREKVSVAPAEVWLIKGMVERIEASMRKGQGNGEHLVKGEESYAGLDEKATEEAKGVNLPSSKAIWGDIFAEETPMEPMYDEEDRVYRCTFCANEVVNGSCTSPNCGMLYNAPRLFYDNSEGSLLDEDYSDDSEADLDALQAEAEAYSGFIDDGPVSVYDSDEDEEYFEDEDGDYGRHNLHDIIDIDAEEEEDRRDSEDQDSSSESVQEVPARRLTLRRPMRVESESPSLPDEARITIDGSEEGRSSDEEELSDSQDEGRDSQGEVSDSHW